MLSGASIWGEGEKAWRSQTLLHHPDPEPNVSSVLKGTHLAKKVIFSSKHNVLVFIQLLIIMTICYASSFRFLLFIH
jgi:hypothetical protein